MLNSDIICDGLTEQISLIMKNDADLEKRILKILQPYQSAQVLFVQERRNFEKFFVETAADLSRSEKNIISSNSVRNVYEESQLSFGKFGLLNLKGISSSVARQVRKFNKERLEETLYQGMLDSYYSFSEKVAERAKLEKKLYKELLEVIAEYRKTVAENSEDGPEKLEYKQNVENLEKLLQTLKMNEGEKNENEDNGNLEKKTPTMDLWSVINFQADSKKNGVSVLERIDELENALGNLQSQIGNEDPRGRKNSKEGMTVYQQLSSLEEKVEYFAKQLEEMRKYFDQPRNEGNQFRNGDGQEYNRGEMGNDYRRDERGQGDYNGQSDYNNTRYSNQGSSYDNYNRGGERDNFTYRNNDYNQDDYYNGRR